MEATLALYLLIGWAVYGFGKLALYVIAACIVDSPKGERPWN